MRHVPSVAVGVVKDRDDPNGEGRVRVEFPWLLQSFRSTWAPIASFLSGRQRGAFFMPELEDEVLVAFDRGDFDHPYIVGFLWNGVDKPPETDLENRVIRTPGGHQLRFEDGAAKKVVLRSSGGHRITLDDTGGGRVEVRSSGGQSIVLSDAGTSIELRGGGRSIALQGGQVRIT